MTTTTSATTRNMKKYDKVTVDSQPVGLVTNQAWSPADHSLHAITPVARKRAMPVSTSPSLSFASLRMTTSHRRQQVLDSDACGASPRERPLDTWTTTVHPTLGVTRGVRRTL